MNWQDWSMNESGESNPRRVEKPWGYEIWWAVTDQYVGKILHVNRGHRLSLQYHEQKDETSYVLSGSLLLVQGQSQESLTERPVGAGDAWHNAPGVIHTIEALEDSDVLEASTPFLDDVVRLSDNYGREGTSSI
jgi:quercetin dioxygenase-like cupin family protein